MPGKLFHIGIVAKIHRKINGVSVIGVLAGIEDNVSAEENIFTDPKKAKEFVDKTGCDSLAVAIGTSHGAYKFKGTQKLRFDILKKGKITVEMFPKIKYN